MYANLCGRINFYLKNDNVLLMCIYENTAYII